MNSKLINSLVKHRWLYIIVLVGILARLSIIFFFAEAYFNRPNIYVDGDTKAWTIAFQNLVETGTYTVNPENEYGFFGRMPGYSFFLGIFWLILRDWEAVYPIVALVQICLDLVSIFLVYKISVRIFSKESIANAAAFLYALYPFIIVWNPVVYSESISVFLMLLSLHFLLKKSNRSFVLSGASLGIGILFRPQLMLLLPVFLMFIVLNKSIRNVKPLILFLLSVLCTYGLWPLRNYVYYEKIILTQDLRGFKNWDKDVISFMQYVYSVKSEWEPQFSSIVQNTKTDWPKEAFLSKGDSIILDRVVYLSKNCSSGFSHWRGYWKLPVSPDESCVSLISKAYEYLAQRQRQENMLNYYLFVPLSNLKKAVFKNSLYKRDSSVRRFATHLFLYRTFLIFIGLFGLIAMALKKNFHYLIILVFTFLLYGALCWGGSPQMRNIEIRYFLHADVLLLFPAAGFLYYIYNIILKYKAKL